MISIDLKGGIIFSYYRVLYYMKKNGVKCFHTSELIEKYGLLRPPFLFNKIMLVTKDDQEY